MGRTADVTANSTAFVALVTRTDCNNGVTGVVLPPTISLDDAQIVVTFTVGRRTGPPTATYTCQGNDAVPYTVELSEPIGNRPLLDGMDGGVRWRPTS